MAPIIAVGETKPGDVMERPFVTLPEAEWIALTGAAQREAILIEQLAQERELSARITNEFQEYMQQHQVLLMQQKAGD